MDFEGIITLVLLVVFFIGPMVVKLLGERGRKSPGETSEEGETPGARQQRVLSERRPQKPAPAARQKQTTLSSEWLEKARKTVRRPAEEKPPPPPSPVTGGRHYQSGRYPRRPPAPEPGPAPIVETPLDRMTPTDAYDLRTKTRVRAGGDLLVFDDDPIINGIIFYEILRGPKGEEYREIG
jgi:hypothetical protein